MGKTLALLAALAAPAAAGMDAGTHVINVGVGGAAPMTDIDTSLAGGGLKPVGAGGVWASGQYLYHVAPSWAVGAEISGGRFADKDHELPTAVATTGASVAAFQAVGRYLVLPELSFSPYFSGGFGVNVFNAKLTATPRTGTTWRTINPADTATSETRTLYDTGTAGISASLGGGLEGRLGEGLTGAIEGRWNYAGITRSKFGANSANFASGGLRIGWKFGP